MKHSIKIGFSFGLTSGIITTLGLIVGLNSGTRSRLAVVGGVLTIAIADAFSDASGIHLPHYFFRLSFINWSKHNLGVFITQYI